MGGGTDSHDFCKIPTEVVATWPLATPPDWLRRQKVGRYVRYECIWKRRFCPRFWWSRYGGPVCGYNNESLLRCIREGNDEQRSDVD